MRPRRRPATGRPAPTPPLPPEPVAVTVERLGAQGDGIARLPDGAPLYLPSTLPGEHVTARPLARRGEGWAGTALARETASPDRIAPPCSHAGDCGGCAVQHLADTAYAAWKRGLLVEALARAGFADPPVAPLVRTAPGTRRRADFALARARPGGPVQVGFHSRGAARVVDLATCLVLDPRLVALLAPLRAGLAVLRCLGRAGDAIVNLTETGPDLLIATETEPDAADRQALAALAAAADLARLSWRQRGARGGTTAAEAEPILVRRVPKLALGGVAVRPPPGAFLQASPAGEAAILAAVLAALDPLAARGGRPRLADLYAGIGTLSFPLARLGSVRALEGDAAALSALSAAARTAGLGGRLQAERRDLARRPLAGAELAGLDALVLDPPHAGATEQARCLAEAPRGPALVVCVSCHPAALARDARVLAAGGYRLETVTPIDQFPWSAELESVAVFRR